MNGNSTDTVTTMTHSFIVKIWLEEIGQEAGRTVWRGHITHVFSGKRHYLQDLEDIPAFVAPYLERMGGKPHLFWRVRQWLRQRVPFWHARIDAQL